MLHAEHFPSGLGERSGLHEPAIAMFDLLLGVAPVQGLRPDKRGRFLRHPSQLPRPQSNAFDRDVLGQGNIGDLKYHPAPPVPDLHTLRKRPYRQQIRERPLDRRYQEVLTVRRRVGIEDECRISQEFLVTIE